MTLCVTEELKSTLGPQLDLVESPSLRLTKYVAIDKKDKEKKSKEIRAVVACHNRYSKAPVDFSPANSVKLYMKLGDRLIINQAGGVLENAGICLHRHFGYPYIPGSAVKGVARHYAWEQWADMRPGEAKRIFAKKIAMTFGFPTGDRMSKQNATRSRQEYLDDYLELEFPELFKDDKAKYKSCSGSVTFFDARPNGTAELESDVLTCHHTKYYGNIGIEDALDNEEPNPQFFPVVKAGVTFVFQLMPLKDDADIEFAQTMLKNGLEINGIGAKTSAGYGWFEEDANAAEKGKIKDIVVDEAVISRYREMSDEEFTSLIRSYRMEVDSWSGTPVEQRSLLEYCLGEGAERVTARKSKQAVKKLADHFKVEF